MLFLSQPQCEGSIFTCLYLPVLWPELEGGEEGGGQVDWLLEKKRQASENLCCLPQPCKRKAPPGRIRGSSVTDTGNLGDRSVDVKVVSNDSNHSV